MTLISITTANLDPNPFFDAMYGKPRKPALEKWQQEFFDAMYGTLASPVAGKAYTHAVMGQPPRRMSPAEAESLIAPYRLPGGGLSKLPKDLREVLKQNGYPHGHAHAINASGVMVDVAEPGEHPEPRAVVASTFQQAELALRQLGIWHGSCRFARDPNDLRGLHAADVLVVYPILEGVPRSDRQRRGEIEDAVRFLESVHGDCAWRTWT